MAKRKFNKQQPIQPVNTEAAAPAVEKQQTFQVQLHVMGGEPIILNGADPNLLNQVGPWFSGLSAAILTIPVGSAVLSVDRSKVSHVVVSEEKTAQPQNN